MEQEAKLTVTIPAERFEKLIEDENRLTILYIILKAQQESLSKWIQL